MGKKKNKILQIERFVICPNCRRPIFRASNLKIKGSAKGYKFCRCGHEISMAFKGTPAGKGAKISGTEHRKLTL
ncbi:MAG: hypothetical protein J6D08_02010 [Lachnospiraceae bacterium]|nr:hypothetical protein [Lachnospiraceae bacterium]